MTQAERRSPEGSSSTGRGGGWFGAGVSRACACHGGCRRRQSQTCLPLLYFLLHLANATSKLRMTETPPETVRNCPFLRPRHTALSPSFSSYLSGYPKFSEAILPQPTLEFTGVQSLQARSIFVTIRHENCLGLFCQSVNQKIRVGSHD